VRFFFPDSQDQVDPSFDFKTEQRSIHRVRQRDDRYAHEVIQPVPYDGLLVSKPIVDGLPGAAGKYTAAQRNRLYREGAHRFFRLTNGSSTLRVMGDCGAFTYVREHEPVYSVEEVIDFYDGCQFDIGIAPDHVVFGYDVALDEASPKDVPEDWRRRQQLTISLASDFLAAHTRRKCTFEPVAVAHGWSPHSYAAAVEELQAVGYRRIALGGMVQLKTPDILDCLKAVRHVRRRRTELHLLGVTRTAHVQDFTRYGVTSFDSTSPFMQAFRDGKDNYYVLDRTYVAIRVPQVDGNTKLRSRVTAGAVDQRDARRLERTCLDRLRKFDSDRCSVDAVIDAVRRYAALLGDTKDRSATYAETLEARPWRSCMCTVCKQIGIEVIIFRGADRNRRRGFHNLAVFAQRLQRDLSTQPAATNGVRRA
jgi:hypothetical protein